MNDTKPVGGFRSSQIYIRAQTRRRLHWLAHALSDEKPGSSTSEPPKILTADELADRIINETIQAKYPQVLKIEKEIKKIEDDLRKLLATKNEQA